MSAYICNPEHIGILAAYAATENCTINEWADRTLIKQAQNVAKGLATENIRSVAHRYPDDKDGQRPGPCLKDADIVEACQIYAAHFATKKQSITPIQVIKLVQSLEYQSCETDDWLTTLAAQQLRWISSAAVRCLPRYEDAAWSFDHSLPEIDALYEKES